MPLDTRQTSVGIALLPLMLVVLVAFVVIGMALPVLPLHVHDGLGFGTAIVGLVTGSQFAASLVSRFWSGRMCDDKGPKRAVMVGLAGATMAGMLYSASVWFAESPNVSVTILLAGRAVLGAAESFIITGAIVWGLARVGAQNAGKVIAWMGTAMFARLPAVRRSVSRSTEPAGSAPSRPPRCWRRWRPWRSCSRYARPRPRTSGAPACFP